MVYNVVRIWVKNIQYKVGIQGLWEDLRIKKLIKELNLIFKILLVEFDWIYFIH